jgi:ABC-type sugar transport system ATPase subunit
MRAHLSLQSISKSFVGIKVLSDVQFEADGGEATALLGANGAGKSTLMNVLGGIFVKDSGTISINGEVVEIRSPRDAARHGIAFVHQELNVLPSMTVAENVFAAGYPARFGIIDRKSMRERTQSLLNQLDCPFGPDHLVERLGIGDRQMVEIVRALAGEPQIIIFDEPTSSLTEREKRRLFDVIEVLKRRGVVIVYITHFLEEVPQLCEALTVMRNGQTVGNGRVADFKTAEIVELMLGQSNTQTRLADADRPRGKPLLKVAGLSSRGVLDNIDLTLHAGEIVGLWGLLGSGRTELVRALSGLDPIDAGRLRLDVGGGLKPVTPRELHAHLGFVTEDRRGEGLLLPLSVTKNVTLANLSRLLNPIRGIDGRREAKLATGLVGQLGIKVSTIDQTVSTLSGGNQQKVVFGRWLATRPKLFFLDEPTRGLDVGAKTEILKLAVELAREGAAILMISSEVEELMRVCGRYLVISRGRIVAELDGSASEGALKRALSDAPEMEVQP